jgi:hypothetical protein
MGTKTKKWASILVTCASALALTPSPASSQVLLVLLFGDKLSTESFQIGIKLDRAFTSQSELDGADVRSGWAFGAFGEIRLNDSWSLQPELTLTTPGGSGSFIGDETGVPELDAVFSDVSVTRKLSYSNLQMFLKVKPGPVAIGVGPQLSYLRKAQDVYQGLVTGEDAFTLESDIVEIMNRWDVGIAANLEWYLKPDRGMKSLRVHVTPFLGLIDTIKDNTGNSVNNWGVSVGVGIPVGASSDEG